MRANYALDFDVVKVNDPRTLYLMTYLTAGSAAKDHHRRPLNISLVVDRSGSMAGDKIEYTRQAAQMLVQNLGVRDILSVVLYNDTVETLLPPEHIQRKDIINQHIRSIKPGGTTNLSGGWLEGCHHVQRNYAPDRLNRVILMTDGLANRGVTLPEKLIAIAQQKLGEGISTTTMGLGSDFNEDLLMAMASAGGGAFYFIESPEVAPLIFQEELQGLLSVVAQNLIVTIEYNQYITSVGQLNAYPTSAEGKRLSFRLGDVFGDEVKAMMLELTLPGIREMGMKQIATLRFDYDELLETGTEHRTIEVPIRINVVAEHDERIVPVNVEVQRSMLLLKAAQARKRAVDSADKGQYQLAAQALRSVADAIEDSQIVDPQLNDERSALLQQAKDIEQGASVYNEYSRKMMSTQAFYTMTSRHDETMVLRVREQKRQPNTEEHAIVPAQPPPPTAGVARLTPTLATWNQKTFRLSGDLIRIGRSTHNEIVVAAKGVSRFHCQIIRDGERLVLEDLESTNGTLVNGVTLRGQYTISVGDEVQLCDEKLFFHDEKHPPV